MATAPDPRKIAAQQRADDAKNMRYVVSVDDTDYVFRFGEMTARDVRDLRREGLTIVNLLQGLRVADFDYLAAVIWMARRQAGEPNLSLDRVESEIRLDQAISTKDENEPEPVEEFPDPQLSGGS